MKKIYLFALLIFSISAQAQYSETFDTDNKGILSGTCSGSVGTTCVTNDFTGVNWTIEGNLSGIDSEGFFTTGGELQTADVDGVACWYSPVLDISTAGADVDFSVDITYELNSAVNSDFVDVEWSVGGAGFTNRVLNVVNTGGHTINSAGTTDGSSTITEAGISGSTLQLRVCHMGNSSGDVFSMDNVSILDAGVALLPVELIYFDAVPVDNKIGIVWRTLTEENNEYFEIQHSTDGINFKKIGKKEGAGTTIVPQNYSAVHKRPALGVNYYRLRQVDFDGAFEYSETLSVEFNSDQFTIKEFYPNPTETGVTHLDYTSTSNEELSVAIFDLAGKQLHQEVRQVAEGISTLTFDFQYLSSGTYLVKLGQSDNIIYKKLVVAGN